MITIEFTHTKHSLELRFWGLDLSERYPKSYNVYSSTCQFYAENKTVVFTGIHAVLSPDEVNRGKNETGLKRLAKFIKKTSEFDSIQIVESNQGKMIGNAIHSLPDELQALITNTV